MAQTWFITGISSGIGRAMAQALLEGGDRVAGTVRDADVVATMKAEFPDRLWVAELDLTETAAIDTVVNRAFEHFGRIDVIINNAGFGLFGALEGISDERIRSQLDTNLVGPIHVTKSAVPHLRSQGGGRIIAISTYGGQAAHPGASLYHASKWGLEGFMESLAQELAPFDIGVTIVEPGSIRTAFRATAGRNAGSDVESYKGTPAGMVRTFLEDETRQPIGDPEKIAKRIIESVGITPAPRRLVLGSDAYAILTKTLSDRLADVQSQSESAASTDFTAS